MRTEDIIRNQELDDERVTGQVVNPSGLVWGNLYGDINSQTDLKTKFDHLEDDIKKLTPEGMITDVIYNNESVVDDNHIARIEVPVDEINNNLSLLKSRADYAERSLKSLNNNISAVDRRVTGLESSIPQQLNELKEEINNEINPKITAVDNRVTALEESVPEQLAELKKEINDEITPKLDKVKKDIEETIIPEIEDLNSKKSSAMYRDEEGILDPAGEGNKYWYLMNSIEFNAEDPEDLLLHVIKDADGKPIPYDIGKGEGGSGTDTNVTVVQVDWPAGISKGSSCVIKVNWSSLKDEVPTGPGSLQVYVNNELKITRTAVKQGVVEFDITNYIIEETSKVMVVATDSYENSSRTVGYISQVDVKVESNFDDNNILSGDVNYTYTPYGLVSKTVHFIVDGEEVGTDVVRSSGEQQTHKFTNWTHGHHTLKVYFTCMIADSEVRSNELYYDLIFDGGLASPIIASTFVDTEKQQYNSFTIPYRVYTPDHNESEVKLFIDDELQSTLTVDQSTHFWESSQDDLGDYVYTIKCGDTERVFPIEIIENEIDVKPVEADKVLELLTVGRSNSEAHPEIWKDENNNISATLSNFNFSSDGWIQKEEAGQINTVLRVSGDARVTIPYKIFERDFKTAGKTIEIELATLDVLNYESMILSCFSGERGITITPQLAKIKSQQSELQTQYKEEDHVRLTFVVEKNVENRLMLMYINGIMCGAVQYPESDNFRQLAPVNISIGSNDATIDIYGIRVYDNNLNRKQVVNNWIADTQSGSLKKDRYLHNDNYNESGEIVISKLPTDVPYMIWDMDLLPQYKGDKRPGNVEYVDLLDESRSFTSTNATYNVQGTSSAVYPVKNIRIKYKQNKDWPDKIFTWLNKMGNTIKSFSITKENGIGDNYFTYKVDYASSEGANNVELTKLYNDVSKVNNLLTPAQKEDSRIRIGIDGYPIVAFQRNADDTVSFVTKANFNNDKANEAVYGFIEGDESWETTNNSAAEALYKLPVTQETFGNSFEIRFPDVDGYDDLTRLKPMSEWVYSTYKELATNEPFEEPITYTYTNVVRSEDGSYSTIQKTETFEADTERYRLVKFKAELADHFNVRSTLFYYLFTHVFLMVDSRAKNAFPTYLKSRHAGDGGDRWFFLPYDMDTALGINNEGKLVFDYNLEDTDKVDGANVFNGQDSVLWCNLREMFDGEIGQLYAALRTNKDVEFSYSEVEKRFNEHQSKWSEVIFNEDSYKKYIVPLKSGDNYLEMLQGSKAEQRNWWLYNRFKYFDSKYLAGDAKSDFIQFRAYAKSNLTLTPYADIYATASFANGMVVSKRATRNEAITLENPLPESASDQETYIYSASQLKYIGDLSGFKPDTLKVANATRLQELKVGDASPDYENNHLTELTLGANKLLKKLDVRNCTKLKQTVDVSGCTNLEECYFDGTAITGLTLPNGGILKKLHLPSTITNLTIRNQKVLTDLTLAGTNNVQTLWLENIPSELIDAKELITSMPTGGAVRLIGFKLNASSANEIKQLYNLLDTMTGLNAQGQDVPKAQVNGIININTITYADYIELSARYTDVIINPQAIMCTVVFKNCGEEVSTQIVVKGSSASDPGVQHKTPDAEYKYIYAGWDQPLDDIESDMIINSTFVSETQTYTFKFDPMSELVEPIADKYVKYNNLLERPNDPYIEGAVFNGWFKEPETVNEFDFTIPITGPFVADENDNPSPITLYGKWTDEYTPSVSIQIKDYNKFELTITDNIAVTGYAITTTNEEPTEFISVTPTSSFKKEHTVTSAATYYVWGKDASGHVGNAQVKAVNLIKQLATGTSATFKCGNAIISNFALQGREIQTHVDLDDHYENLVIKIDSVISENDSVKVVEDDLIVATLCTPKSYTVKFNTLGKGSSIEDQAIVYNNLVRQPQNQYVEGYIIEGWYKEEALENKWNFDLDIVSGNTTLYAKWIVYIAPSKIAVTVDDDHKDIKINFYQSVANGVKLNFGDGSADEYISSAGNVSKTHQYQENGKYYISLTSEHGTCLIGKNYDVPAIEPITQVEEVEFAFNVPYTNPGAFRGAINLSEINLTDYMTKVSAYTFEGCTNVTSLSIPNNITELEDGCFKRCSGIAGEQTLSSNIVSIGNSSFMGCSRITKFNLPSTLSSIPSSAFSECSSLEEFDLSNITSIGSSAFSGCVSLKEVDLCESITYVGAGAFAACSSLEKVVLRNEETEFESVPFNICPKLKSAGPIGGGYNIEYAFTTKIPSNVFSFGFTQSSLKNVVLPETIEHIGDSAFINSSITSITLPMGLKTIGERAFERTPLTKLDVPISVESVGARMLAYTSVYDVKFHFTNSTYKADAVGNSFFYGSFVKDSIVIHLNKGLTTVSCRDAYGLAWNYINETIGLDDNLVFDLEG